MSRRRLLDVLANLRRNGALGRVEVGFLFATMVEWAGWLTLVVCLRPRRPAEAGLIGFAVGVPPIFVAPTAAILGDRFPRARVMLAAYVAQAIAFAATAAAFMLDAPLLGYALGITAMALIALTRPLLASILPEVARSPEELTAANVASGIGEGLGALGGSFATGVLFALGGASFILIGGAGVMVAAALLILPLAIRARSIDLDAMRPEGAGLGATVRAVARELAAGAVPSPRSAACRALDGVGHDDRDTRRAQRTPRHHRDRHPRPRRERYRVPRGGDRRGCPARCHPRDLPCRTRTASRSIPRLGHRIRHRDRGGGRRHGAAARGARARGDGHRLDDGLDRRRDDDPAPRRGRRDDPGVRRE